MSNISINSNYRSTYNMYYQSAARKNPKAERRDTMSFCGCASVDSEEKAIMDRLWMYGCVPTGDKATDKAKLRRIEFEKAKQDNYVSNKYLTVSAGECERIQERKKENRKIANPEKVPKKQDERLGDKLRGEQIYLAIKMKEKRENSESSSKKSAA